MINLKLIFFLIFFITYACNSEKYLVEKLGIEDGLSQSYVYCMFQDSRGFLWFGTRNGLNRYDGRDFLVFKNSPFDSTTIADNQVSSISEDTDGNIWVAAPYSKLSKLNSKTGKVKRYYFEDGSIKNVSSIDNKFLFADKSGKIWYWYPNSFKYYDSKKDKFVNFLTGIRRFDSILNKYQLYDYYVKPDNSILLLFGETGNTNCIYNSIVLEIDKTRKHFKLIHVADKLMFPFFSGLSTQSRILISYQTDKFNFRIMELDLDKSEMLDMGYKFDRKWFKNNFKIIPILINNTLWMRVTHSKSEAPENLKNYNGLYCFSDTKNIKFDKKYQVSNIDLQMYKQRNEYFSIFYNSRKILWDNVKDGIAKLVPLNSSIITFRHAENDVNSISSNKTRSVLVDKSDNIWVGTESGLNKYDREKNNWKKYFIRGDINDIAQNISNFLYEDTDKSILACTNFGLFNFNNLSKYKQLNYRIPGLAHWKADKLYSVTRDKWNNLWVGTMYGIRKFNNSLKLLVNYEPVTNKKNSLSDSQIWALYMDSKGTIWVGTNDGLNKYIPEIDGFKNYQHDIKNPKSLCGNKIWTIIEDRNKNLWVGAYGAGISKYNPEKDDFYSLTTAEGLPDDGIVSMVCDFNNNLWLGSTNGLIKYDQKSRTFSRFTKSDGFQGDEYSFHSAAITNEGDLVFGGLNGVTIFKPKNLILNNNIPKIFITKVFIKDKLESILKGDGDEICTDWKFGYLRLQLAAIDYTNPNSNEYAYMLEGVNNDWIYIGNQNIITFSGLEPGNYTLRIKGSNNNDIWNDKGIRIYLRITPPFWKTNWFRILLYLSIISTIVFISVFLIRRRREQEYIKHRMLTLQLRTIQSQMNPHFIFNCLNSILNLILQNEKERAMDFLSKFSRLLRKILENSRKITVPLDDVLEQLRIYLDLELLRHKNKFSYIIVLDEHIDSSEINIPALLLQPYIENSIKHGRIYEVPEGYLKIKINKSGNILECVITDNGIGRDKSMEIKKHIENNHKSLGSELTAESLSLLNSSVNITDLKNELLEPTGTQVHIMINLEGKFYE